MAGTARSRQPVKTGAHRDIERQLGAPPMRPPSDVPPAELDELPPGWKSRYDEHQEAQEKEAALRSASRSRSNTRPPTHPRRPAAAARSRRSSRSGGSATRRTTRPSLSDPTGGRLPIGFDGQGVAGVFFGAVFYALVLSVADYGPTGPLLWFKAKFLNQPAPPKT